MNLGIGPLLVIMGHLVVPEVCVAKLELTRLEVAAWEATGSQLAALGTAWSGTIIRCLRFLLSLVVGVSTQ